MKFAKTLLLDESDNFVYELPAQTDEWATSGSFEFSNSLEEDLKGKRRQAFSNGWLGLESFGRATLVSICNITEREYQQIIEKLASHFVDRYNAPNLEAAFPVAKDEIDHMAALCQHHADNTLLTVQRDLIAEGVREQFRVIVPDETSLSQFTDHMPRNRNQVD